MWDYWLQAGYVGLLVTSWYKHVHGRAWQHHAIQHRMQKINRGPSSTFFNLVQPCYVVLLVTNWLCGITGYKVVIWNYWLKTGYVELLVKNWLCGITGYELVMWDYWLKTGYVELLVTSWLCGITGYKLVMWNYCLQTGYVGLLVTNWLCGITG